VSGREEYLAAFVDALGLEWPHLLGLSFGAGLALELYRSHPTVPRTLVLASAYAGWTGSLPADVVEQRLQQVLWESELPPDQVVPGSLPGLFTESALAELIDEMVAIMSEFHPAGVRAMARAFAEADLRDVLPRIMHCLSRNLTLRSSRNTLTADYCYVFNQPTPAPLPSPKNR
jgi:pimeloyl-ACP methyl ester carboxylesterase